MVGILVGTSSSIIHFKPNDRITSTVVFIAAGVIYGFIFGILCYFKVQRSKEMGGLQRWMTRNEKPRVQEIEMK